MEVKATSTANLISSEDIDSKVDHPAHYNRGPMEVIDIIEGFGLGFHVGNVLKYILRAPHKGREVEDLKKARWYLDRHISRLEKTRGDLDRHIARLEKP